MYNALMLAEYIVTKCTREGCPISNLQLQKILFYIQKMFLLKNKKRAFYETIEAWKFGPVVPSVYYKFCSLGAMSIIKEYDNADAFLSDEDKAIIDAVVEGKRVLAPWDLVEATHKKGGAWDRIYNDGHGNHKEIPIKFIIEELNNDSEASN